MHTSDTKYCEHIKIILGLAYCILVVVAFWVFIGMSIVFADATYVLHGCIIFSILIAPVMLDVYRKGMRYAQHKRQLLAFLNKKST